MPYEEILTGLHLAAPDPFAREWPRVRGLGEMGQSIDATTAAAMQSLAPPPPTVSSSQSWWDDFTNYLEYGSSSQYGPLPPPASGNYAFTPAQVNAAAATASQAIQGGPQAIATDLVEGYVGDVTGTGPDNPGGLPQTPSLPSWVWVAGLGVVLLVLLTKR